MSQDSNNNLFGNFQPSPFDPSTMYHPDIASMQFAASVPPRPSSAQQQHGMNFASFPNLDVVLPHHPACKVFICVYINNTSSYRTNIDFYIYIYSSSGLSFKSL